MPGGVTQPYQVQMEMAIGVIFSAHSDRTLQPFGSLGRATNRNTAVSIPCRV